MKEREPMTPVTYRYILIGLLEDPMRYYPRTPVQQEALKCAVTVMEKYQVRAVCSNLHIATIRTLASRRHISPRNVEGYSQSMNAAIRSVDIAVREFKHEQAVGDYYERFRRKDGADNG